MSNEMKTTEKWISDEIFGEKLVTTSEVKMLCDKTPQDVLLVIEMPSKDNYNSLNLVSPGSGIEIFPSQDLHCDELASNGVCTKINKICPIKTKAERDTKKVEEAAMHYISKVEECSFIIAGETIILGIRKA